MTKRRTIEEYVKGIEDILDRMKQLPEFTDEYELELVEETKTYSGETYKVPSKIVFSGMDTILEMLDLKENHSLEHIEIMLRLAIERIPFYEKMKEFAQSNGFECVQFKKDRVILYTNDRKEIEIKSMRLDRFNVSGRYILADNAMHIRYQLEEGLYFSLCQPLPMHASVRSAVTIDDQFVISYEELYEAIAKAKQQLDYASERYVDMMLVKKGDH